MARSPYSVSDELSRKLDATRVILAVLIVWLHADTSTMHFRDQTRVLSGTAVIAVCQRTVSQGMGKVAVPLFFGIAGYLFFLGLVPTPAGFGRKIGRRLRTLVPVYLFWSGVWLVVFWVASRTSSAGPLFSHPFLVGASLSDVLWRWLVEPVPSQLWFLRSLVLLACASPLVYAAVRRGGLWTVAFLLAVWLFPYDIPWIQTRAAAFFALGAYLAVRHPQVLEHRSTRATWLLVPWIALVIIRVIFEARTGLHLDQMLTLAVLIGVPAVWLAIDYIPPAQLEWLRSLGPYSFFVILAHEPAQGTVLKVLARAFGDSPWVDAVAFVVVPVAMILSLLALAALMERHTPRVLGFLTGGRSGGGDSRRPASAQTVSQGAVVT